MEWKEWIDRIVFIKLDDGQYFSKSRILAYEEPFMSLSDKFGYPVIINVKHIVKIKVEGENL